MKKMNKFKEPVAAKKPMSKGGKKVSGKKYSEVKEEYDDKIGDEDNHPSRKPADISGALKRAKEGYSKKPRVKPEKMKGKGK